MKAILARLLRCMEEQTDAVLVTIVADSGSAPRDAGAQMLVTGGGIALGTIGGGAVEKRSAELALEALREKRSRIHEFTLRRNEEEDIGMICGGDVTVLLQYISWEDLTWKQVAEAAVQALQAGRAGWLVQRLDGAMPSFLDEEGEVRQGALLAGRSALTAGTCVRVNGYFSMPLPLGERAVIVGGGHCAAALAPLLKSVGFRVTVLDNRPEFARRERFPQAEQVLLTDYLRLEETLPLTEDDYVVVMTHGHSHDYEVQEQVLRRPLAYIGVIGSRTKAAALRGRLRKAGIPEEILAGVHSPIGTAIKAVTPEEIAVSIAGELIYERALRREAAARESA